GGDRAASRASLRCQASRLACWSVDDARNDARGRGDARCASGLRCAFREYATALPGWPSLKRRTQQARKPRGVRALRATALFGLAVFGHAGAVQLRLRGAPAMLRETARHARAVLERLGACAAHTALAGNGLVGGHG